MRPLQYWLDVKLIWVFDGHKGFIVGFVVRWVLFFCVDFIDL